MALIIAVEQRTDLVCVCNKVHGIPVGGKLKRKLFIQHILSTLDCQAAAHWNDSS